MSGIERDLEKKRDFGIIAMSKLTPAGGGKRGYVLHVPKAVVSFLGATAGDILAWYPDTHEFTYEELQRTAAVKVYGR